MQSGSDLWHKNRVSYTYIRSSLFSSMKSWGVCRQGKLAFNISINCLHFLLSFLQGAKDGLYRSRQEMTEVGSCLHVCELPSTIGLVIAAKRMLEPHCDPVGTFLCSLSSSSTGCLRPAVPKHFNTGTPFLKRHFIAVPNMGVGTPKGQGVAKSLGQPSYKVGHHHLGSFILAREAASPSNCPLHSVTTLTLMPALLVIWSDLKVQNQKKKIERSFNGAMFSQSLRVSAAS